VLVADTTVTVAHAVLGKPTDDADALFMLEQLVGRQHQVKTCYAIARYDRPAEALVRTVTTEVTMRAASLDELRRYVASGECNDKAGAYAIQGLGGFLVESIKGSFTNVVGLPACEVVLDLKALGVLGAYP
jgi:septum formation protein